MVTRRSILATTALAAAGLALPALSTRAQDATPEAEAEDAGVASLRVRGLATPELAEAITANVMADFVPNVREVEGYVGYALAYNNDNPSSLITLTLAADETSAADIGSVSQEFTEALDPRFATEVLGQSNGPVRLWQLTTRTTAELPPNLSGCFLTARQRKLAEGVDLETVIGDAQEGLVPLIAELPGFIMYAFVQTEDGAAGYNIWETAEDMDNGNAAIA